MKRMVFASILILLMVVAVMLYILDIVLHQTPALDNLFRMMAAVCICAGGLVRVLGSGKKERASLSFYQNHYQEQIGDAFADQPIYRKKLLCAIRLYNEDNLYKSVKYLAALKPVCKTHDDVYAVGLFLGIALTDMGLEEEAVNVYRQLIDMNVTSSTIYNNLGRLYSGMGKYEDAKASFHLSIQNDEKNPAPYNNLAKLYFDTFSFEQAKTYAQKALEINHKFRQSATLLAILYSLEGDTQSAEKYSHVALAAGEDPQRLKEAIEHYMSEAASKDRRDTASDVAEEANTKRER